MGYTAKVARGAGVEYLGIFDSEQDAQDAYDTAKVQFLGDDDDDDVPMEEPLGPTFEPTGEFLPLRDRLLAAGPTVDMPLPIRGANLGAPVGVSTDLLRELAMDSAARADAVAKAEEDAAAKEEEEEPAAATQGGKKKKKQPALYNKVVTVANLPPCYAYTFWFVYQYVPDMEWCHLCPMEPYGFFGPNSKREGRPRWRLVPEGDAREIDVAAHRCTPMKHNITAKTQSADKEIFDIFDADAPKNPIPTPTPDNVVFSDALGSTKLDAPPPQPKRS